MSMTPTVILGRKFNHAYHDFIKLSTPLPHFEDKKGEVVIADTQWYWTKKEGEVVGMIKDGPATEHQVCVHPAADIHIDKGKMEYLSIAAIPFDLSRIKTMMSPDEFMVYISLDSIRESVKLRIHSLLYAAIMHGVDTLIFNDYGVINYENPTSLVADVFTEELLKARRSFNKIIVVANSKLKETLYRQKLMGHGLLKKGEE